MKAARINNRIIQIPITETGCVHKPSMFLPGYRRFNSGGKFTSFILLKDIHRHPAVYITIN
jgi:hypothetical protein